MAIEVAPENDPKLRRRILEALTQRLPQWFAQPESNRHYALQAEVLEGWVARVDGQADGLLLVKKHGSASAEVYWLGVDPDLHRRGIGRALMDAVERQLRQEKIKFLFVVTLHPDDPYEPYRRTRAFYERLGFELALPWSRGLHGSAPPSLAYYLKSL